MNYSKKIIAILCLLMLGGCHQHYYGNPHGGHHNNGVGKHGKCPPGHHKKGHC